MLAEAGLDGEVVVVDNGSTDGSAALAREAGARVVEEPRRGYGQAYLTGFDATVGDYIVMIDADLTYDFDEIPRFVHELDSGAQLVMGNRMEHIEPGAMSTLSRDRQPDAVGIPEPRARIAGARRPLRPARPPPRCAAAARPPLDGDGVRVRDGDPRRQS